MESKANRISIYFGVKNNDYQARARGDILRWIIKAGKEKNEFVLDELGNWLLENHQPFKDEFVNDRRRKS